jgi:hypothetical protein
MSATPGSPRRRSTPLGPGATAMPAAARPGDPAASKRVSISDPLVSSPSQQENLPGNCFSPTLRAGSSFTASTKAVPTAPAETAYEDRSLSSSALLLSQCSKANHVEAAYAPTSWPEEHCNNLVLQHRCTLCSVLV